MEEIICCYTRAEALEDGVLVDLNQYIPVNECGYKYPVVCTSAVFSIIESAVNNKKHCNDYKGVIWDILTMSRIGRKSGEDTVYFQVIITGAGKSKYHNFKIVCHGGDQGEPVLTIMLPDED